MALRGSETVFKSFEIKPQVLVIVILALMTAGCMDSKKTQSLNHVALASDKPADDDFDLLEEELDVKMIEVADPLEPVNRIMYGLNDILYFWAIKPCAETCEQVVPKTARMLIRNFFNNLTTPIRFVNCHLQGKTTDADMELNRFLINSTVGIVGFGDPAKDQHGLKPPEKEDFGQTLATYGMDNGFYIVLPLFGPSTLRDSIGKVGGLFLDPVSYVEPIETALGINAARITNENSFHLGEYENFKSDALDHYVAMREVYIQYRREQITK